MEELMMERGDAIPVITCDAPGYALTGLLKMIGMLVVPSDMELPEEVAAEVEE